MNLLQAFSSKSRERPSSLQANRRIYAVGDIHGSAQLMARLVDNILADSAARPHVESTLVILGDFIDRGANSAAVVRSLYSQRSSENLVVLLGNHEAAMISAYRGDQKALSFWLKFGGVETLSSFGADTENADLSDVNVAMGLLQQSVPFEVINWMENLPTSYRAGDYLFVHAGVRPGVRLNRQQQTDLLWIRDEFLESEDDHGAIIVHGHTPVEHVDFKPNRIGVDTGAYRTGILSALGLEGDKLWVVDTGQRRKEFSPAGRSKSEPLPIRT